MKTGNFLDHFMSFEQSLKTFKLFFQHSELFNAWTSKHAPKRLVLLIKNSHSFSDLSALPSSLQLILACFRYFIQ